MSVGVEWLRGYAGTKRVSLADVADTLDRLAEKKEPDKRWVISDVAMVLADMEESPLVTRPMSRWAWPRPEWLDWQNAVERILDSVPDNLWRSLVLHSAFRPGVWLQIAGKYDDFSIQLCDPLGEFTDLASLEWTPNKVEDMPEVFWVHDYTMKYAGGAVDRAAQALALVVQVQPSAVRIEDLTF